MKLYEAHFFDRVDGELVTYRETVRTTSKSRAQVFFKDLAKDQGWRLVQFYEL